MRIPVVTFAVGGWVVYLLQFLNIFVGIGEYVHIPKIDGHQQYQIGTNALVLNVATPDAVSLAVLHLVSNSTLRKEIGDSGFQTITSRFSIQNQMRRYERLYSLIASEKLIKQQY